MSGSEVRWAGHPDDTVLRFSEFLHLQCLERKYLSREPLRNKIEV